MLKLFVLFWVLVVLWLDVIELDVILLVLVKRDDDNKGGGGLKFGGLMFIFVWNGLGLIRGFEGNVGLDCNVLFIFWVGILFLLNLLLIFMLEYRLWVLIIEVDVLMMLLLIVLVIEDIFGGGGGLNCGGGLFSGGDEELRSLVDESVGELGIMIGNLGENGVFGDWSFFFCDVIMLFGKLFWIFFGWKGVGLGGGVLIFVLIVMMFFVL